MKSVEEWHHDSYYLRPCDLRGNIRAIQADARAQGWADALEAVVRKVDEWHIFYGEAALEAFNEIRALKPGAGK